MGAKRQDAVSKNEIAALAPIGVEIAAARRDLLLSARQTAASAAAQASAASSPVSRSGVRSTAAVSDHASTALEDNLQLSAPLALSDGMLRASLSRLDSRVRALESQGTRGDRRAAELAGLAQALTEEQRALLIRMDRLEEQCRAMASSRPSREMRSSRSELSVAAPSDDVTQRLDHLEQELRMASTNFRLVMSLVDEAEQRQTQRFRSLEAQYDDPSKVVPSRPVLEERSDKVGLQSCDSLHAQLDVAETKTAQSLKSAQELLHRCSTSMSAHLEQENRDPRLGIQTLESHEEAIRELQSRFSEFGHMLVPKTEIIEAKVRELDDVVKGFKEQVLSSVDIRFQSLELLSRKALDDQATAVEELSERATSLPTREQISEMTNAHEVASISRQVNSHENRLTELCTKLELLPTHDHILAECKDLLGAPLGAANDIRARMDEFEDKCSMEQSRVEEMFHLQGTSIQELQLGADQQLRHAEQLPKVEQPMGARTLQSLEEHSASISALHNELKLLPTAHQLTEMREVLDGYGERLDALGEDVRATTTTSKAAVSSGSPLGDVQRLFDQQRARMEVLVNEIRAVATTSADAVAELRCELHDAIGQHTVSDACNSDFIKILCAEHVQSISGSLSTQAQSEECSSHAAAEGDSGSPPKELSCILEKVFTQFKHLQQKVEDNILVSVGTMEQQLPEALKQLENISSALAEHTAKIEEHEVRLGLAISRQAAGEQKFQICMDRIEKMPGIPRLRTVCHEEMVARLADADIAGLAAKLELTMDAVTELAQKVESLPLRRHSLVEQF